MKIVVHCPAALKGIAAMNMVEFIDTNVRVRENGELWGLTKHQGAVLTVMYKRDYTTRLWSEIKKSGITYVAGCVLVYPINAAASRASACVAD
jgi:hypothetical protein